MSFGAFSLNTINCVDSYDAIKQLPDKCIDLVIIDPPYKISGTKGSGFVTQKHAKAMFNMLKEYELDKSFDFSILKELDRVMKKRNIYVWCNKLLIPELFHYYLDDNKKTKFEIITWHKTNAMPLCGSKYLSDTEYCLYFHEQMHLNTSYETAHTHYEQPINIKDKKRYGHPTIKPLNIIENLIVNSSNPSDVVFDCFAGVGTTAVACKHTGRNYICFDINKTFVDVAESRLKEVSM